jgi:virginiamycin A acetyltransferase
LIRKRLDDELIALLLEFKWWNLRIDEIKALLPLLSNHDLDKVRAELRARLGKAS